MKTMLLIAIIAIAPGLFSQSEPPKFAVEASRCIGCAQCIPSCPVGAISLVEGRAVIDPAKCISCGLCSSKCPVYAIAPVSDGLAEETQRPEPDSIPPSIDSTSVVKTVETAKTVYSEKIAKTPPSRAAENIEPQIDSTKSAPEARVSPPALEPSKCISCGICARVCPEGAIALIGGLPKIDEDKCIGCGKCIQRCPTRALTFREEE